MAGIDLRPRQYALKRRLWRRCKSFAAGVLAIVCLVATARGALWLGGVHEQGQLSSLRQNEQLSAADLAKARHLEGEKAAAQKELTTLEDLRGRHRVRALVDALDRAYLSGVWFDEIRSFRAGVAPAAGSAPNGTPAVAPQPSAGQPTSPAPADNRQRVELAGHAVEHSRLADFMTRLAAQPSVSDLRLLDTSSNGDGSEPAIDFRMSLAIAAGVQP
jgi:Fimbrial assembly protein (PilN)